MIQINVTAPTPTASRRSRFVSRMKFTTVTGLSSTGDSASSASSVSTWFLALSERQGGDQPHRPQRAR
ncbi:MAG: hypothetical protein B7W97_02430 [Mycobacterium sp. 20-66-4]|nr:MAG: hypothetical protein B7W97_02430 [Mycobacterium sp. 20-66-4]